MEDSKDIRHCELYPRYYADAFGNVYLDEAGEQKVGVYVHKGHLCVTTYPHVMVHQIVYATFHSDTPKGRNYHVHHLDENPRNNALSNLILLTHEEHMRLHWAGEKNPNYGKTGEKHHNYGAKSPKARAVIQYTKEGVFVAEYPCLMEASRINNIPHNNISLCCKYKRKTAGNCQWRWADEPLPPKPNLDLF